MLNNEEIENLNRRIISKENGSVIKNVPLVKSPEPDGFIIESYTVSSELYTQR